MAPSLPLPRGSASSHFLADWRYQRRNSLVGTELIATSPDPSAAEAISVGTSSGPKNEYLPDPTSNTASFWLTAPG